MANCDSAAVAIERPRFAGDVAFADEGAQVFGCCPSRRPSIGARLAGLGVSIPQGDRSRHRP